MELRLQTSSPRTVRRRSVAGAVVSCLACTVGMVEFIYNQLVPGFAEDDVVLEVWWNIWNSGFARHG